MKTKPSTLSWPGGRARRKQVKAFFLTQITHIRFFMFSLHLSRILRYFPHFDSENDLMHFSLLVSSKITTPLNTVPRSGVERAWSPASGYTKCALPPGLLTPGRFSRSTDFPPKAPANPLAPHQQNRALLTTNQEDLQAAARGLALYTNRPSMRAQGGK